MLPILAANWIETLLPLIFVFIWIARAFMEAKGNQGKEAAAEESNELELAEREGRNNEGRKKEGMGAGGQQAIQEKPEQPGKAAAGDPFRSEVDEFLRRLSGEQGQQADPLQPSPADRARARAEKDKAQRTAAERAEERRRSARERRERQRREAARAEYDRSFERQGQETVGEHVRQHVGRLKESQLAENAAHLGEQLAQTDERTAERLQRKFDHKLGKLEQRGDRQEQEPASPAVPSTAESLAAMLSNPEGIRNAIVLNEILNRPADRW